MHRVQNLVWAKIRLDRYQGRQAGTSHHPMPRKTAERPLPPAEDHAARFTRQREADRAATAEDYVELIADLLHEGGEARRWTLRAAWASPGDRNSDDRPATAGWPGRNETLSGLFLSPAGAEDGRRGKDTA